MTDIASHFPHDTAPLDTDSYTNRRPAGPEKFAEALRIILQKLGDNSKAIDAEDVRRLHEARPADEFHRDDEQYNPNEHTERIISAVEALAEANEKIHKESHPEKHPKATMLTSVRDLHAAVETNPEDVTAEVLKTTQGLVSRMQKAVGYTSPLRPELESELQSEYTKIEPKVEHGTVRKAGADRLHSLKARAHGHTEKGSLTAIAQSVTAKRERLSSLNEASNKSAASGDQSYQELDLEIAGISLESRRKDEAETGNIFHKESPTIQHYEYAPPNHADRDDDASTLVAGQGKSENHIPA